MKEIEPAPYSHTDPDERIAITVFEQLIDQNLVKAHIGPGDKFPNVDGYLEIVREDQVPIGQIWIQIKKIPENATSYCCDIRLFGYSNRTTLPVILVCVDTARKKAFWKHIDYKMTLNKEDQKTITINFSQAIDEIDSDLLYLSKWVSLITEYKTKIFDYERLKNQLGEMKAGPEIVRLQSFIDELNRLLDYDCKIVKRIFFRGVWKLGIAIHSYDKEHVSFSLFSVKEGYNDALIKKIDIPPNTHIFNLKGGSSDFLSYWGRNEFNTDPKKLARYFVHNWLKDVLNKKLLSIRNRYLANEYLFDFVDSHLYCLGLPESDRYLVEDVSFAFNEYLPRWCITAVKLVNYPKHLDHIDPELISALLAPNYSEIDRKVKEDIEKNRPIPPIPIGGLFFSFRLVDHLISYCLSESIQQIDRIYKKREPGSSGGFIWDRYKEPDLRYNAEILLNNFEDVYNDVIIQNGFNPLEYSLFKEYDKVLFVYTLLEQYPRDDGPTLHTYKLKLKKGTKDFKKIEVFNSKDFSPDISYENPEIEYQGRVYIAEGWSFSVADFFFHRTPMLEFIYKHLTERVKKIFEKNA